MSLSLGSLGACVVVGLYAAGLVARSRTDMARSVAYNAPIAFVFLVLATYLVVRAVEAPNAFVQRYGVTLVIWVAGGVILYLRLVSKTLEVSGHLAWLPMLTTMAWVERFPTGFVVIAGLSTVAAAYMKLALFGGPSVWPGIAAGVVLACALVVTRPTAASRIANGRITTR